jgi:hypothetical protein
MTTANTFGDYVRKYWLVFVLVLAVGLGLLVIFFPAGDDKEQQRREGILRDTRRKVDEIKANAAEELKAHNEAMEARRTELAEIKKISDEEKRLAELAAFANRRANR